MREKKLLTIITLACTLIALIIAFVIGKDTRCIVYDIAMAVFGSALLGFIMSLTGYFVERRSAVEGFWQESRKALAKLRKVKYIDIDAPVDRVLACFREEWNNDLTKMLDSTVKSDAKNSLISWYEENIPMSWTGYDDIDSELNKMYDKKMQDYRDEYIKCIDSYIEASSTELEALGNAYGNLDFLFENNCIREKAFSEVYDKIRTFRNLLLSERYHFSLLKTQKGNFSICVEKANHICQKIFDVQRKAESKFETKIVYQKAFDDIDEALETFRLQIYHNTKPDFPERIPVLGNTIIKDFDDNL